MTLEAIQGGHIFVDGQPLWHEEKNGQLVDASEKHLRTMRKKMGMVFQQFNLFPHMTVERNITEAPINVVAMSKAKAKKRACDYLDLVGIIDNKDENPSQLFRSQQQPLTIASAQ